MHWVILKLLVWLLPELHSSPSNYYNTYKNNNDTYNNIWYSNLPKIFYSFYPEISTIWFPRQSWSSDDSGDDSDTADTAESSKDHTWSFSL